MKGRGVIQNGNKLVPKTIDGKKIILLNTCPLDSITEILSSSCCSILKFKDFIEKAINKTLAGTFKCYASSVITYASSGVNNTFYTSRTCILSSINPPVNEAVDCEANIGSLFQTLMEQYESTVETCTCSKCNVQSWKKAYNSFVKYNYYLGNAIEKFRTKSQ